ncbi:MAG TPA: hypothetical protein VHA80_06045, partial [Solirubrobacterales bacterium]|nr:hypothetical protein [Solirubrobacterales bacterium]
MDRGDKRLAFGQFTLVGVSGDRGEHPFEQRHGVRAGKLAPLQPANQRTGAGEAGGAPLADASVFGVVDLVDKVLAEVAEEEEELPAVEAAAVADGEVVSTSSRSRRSLSATEAPARTGRLACTAMNVQSGTDHLKACQGSSATSSCPNPCPTGVFRPFGAERRSNYSASPSGIGEVRPTRFELATFGLK